MLIRNMTLKDLEEVDVIEQSCFSMPWSKESMEESLKNPENIYLVMEEDGRIDGYLGVWCVAGEGQLNNIAISSKERKKGKGRKLLEALFEEAACRKLTGITLEVRKSNAPAIALYEKAGFETAGIRRGFYDKPKEDAVIMWKYFK